MIMRSKHPVTSGKRAPEPGCTIPEGFCRGDFSNVANQRPEDGFGRVGAVLMKM
jgi:hypothetical protein